jgi:hypothetical protein
VANAGSVQTIHRVYAVASDFLADLAIREHNLNYAREALEILATNRAADMREARTLAWHKNGQLPPRYYQLLEKLRTEEAELILDSGNKQGSEASARQTRADLSLLETQLALDSEKSVNSNERFGPQKTLKDIQQSLSDSDALFTFNVGRARSWLWAIGRQSFAVYQLPGERTLERQSSAWATQIWTGKPGTTTGIDLAKSLFSQVSADVLEKHNWLVVNETTPSDTLTASSRSVPGVFRTPNPTCSRELAIRFTTLPIAATKTGKWPRFREPLTPLQSSRGLWAVAAK